MSICLPENSSRRSSTPSITWEKRRARSRSVTKISNQLTALRMIFLLLRRDHPARWKACYPALVTAFCQYSSDQLRLHDAVEPELPPLAFVEVVAVEQGDAALHHLPLDPP